MSIFRLEPATGLLVRGISVNGNYLIVENCTITTQQEIEQKWLIQGGAYPGPAVYNKKYIEGQITCPIRVDRGNTVDPAIINLLSNAQKPNVALRIDTNHVLSHLAITASDPGTDNNQFISFDCCLVKKLAITASNNGEPLKLTADIVGMIDSRAAADVVAPPGGYNLGRALTWADCNASRFQSAMRNVSGFNLECSAEVETPAFINPAGTDISARTDQISVLVSHKWKWNGSYEEFIRLNSDIETYVHGGWMVGENLTFSIGPISATIPVPLFSPSDQPLTAKLLKRNVKFASQMAPAYLSQGGLFIFPE